MPRAGKGRGRSSGAGHRVHIVAKDGRNRRAAHRHRSQKISLASCRTRIVSYSTGAWRDIAKAQWTTEVRRQKLKDVFRRYQSQPLDRVIKLINPMLRGWVAYFAVGCSPIAYRKEGRAYSLPPGPRRIASRICPDLISDRHTVAVTSPSSANGTVVAEGSEEKTDLARPIFDARPGLRASDVTKVEVEITVEWRHCL